MTAKNSVNLTTILEQEENQLLEFKSARIHPRDFANLLIAFANADGRIVVVGVEKDKTISGIKKIAKRQGRGRSVYYTNLVSD